MPIKFVARSSLLFWAAVGREAVTLDFYTERKNKNNIINIKYIIY